MIIKHINYIINSLRWLLTAAHCSEDFNSTTSDKFNEFRKTGDLKVSINGNLFNKLITINKMEYNIIFALGIY